MANLSTINQLGASLGDTFGGQPIIEIRSDGEYVFGPIDDPTGNIDSLVGGFFYLSAEDTPNHIFAMNGQTIVGGAALYPMLAARWAGWVSGADIVLPDWRGRAMMATGALGITGAVGDTYADATSVNGLKATLRTRSTAGGNAFNEAVAAFTNTANLNQQGSVINQMSGDAYTRPNAVGLVLCVMAKVLVTFDAPSPRIYTNVADQAIPDTNKNTYAVDLPDLEVGDTFTVVVARGTLVYDLTGRFLSYGQEHEFIFSGLTWRVEIIGSQLRLEAVAGGGTQAVKAIFIDR